MKLTNWPDGTSASEDLVAVEDSVEAALQKYQNDPSVDNAEAWLELAFQVALLRTLCSPSKSHWPYPSEQITFIMGVEE